MPKLSEICWHHNNAENGCRFGKECFKKHVMVKPELRSKIPKPQPRSRSASRGSTGSRGGGKGKSGGKGKAMVSYCTNHVKGNCTKGNDCWFPHVTQEVANEMDRAAKVRAKAKGKANPKPKAKAAASS